MMMDEFSLSDLEFEGIRSRIYRMAGIALGDAKRSMVVARLQRLLRQLKLRTFTDYFAVLDAPGSDEHVQDFVNALTTNLTRFWREEHHFDHLLQYVGELIEQRPRRSPDGRPRLRIWSAGCSTGQESYCIAMDLLAAYPELKRWDFRILATDVDTSVIAKAGTGVYLESELAGVGAARGELLEHPGDGTVRVPMAARNTIAFKPLNLIESWPMHGPFDAVFCRNVTIYFDKLTQSRVFDRIGSIIAPGGYLYIGHSENLGHGGETFRLVGKTVYQTTGKAEARSAA
jgi:chemotaxis protein methyltransferase CheR